jgi:hypothetical protein
MSKILFLIERFTGMQRTCPLQNKEMEAKGYSLLRKIRRAVDLEVNVDDFVYATSKIHN